MTIKSEWIMGGAVLVLLLLIARKLGITKEDLRGFVEGFLNEELGIDLSK